MTQKTSEIVALKEGLVSGSVSVNGCVSVSGSVS